MNKLCLVALALVTMLAAGNYGSIVEGRSTRTEFEFEHVLSDPVTMAAPSVYTRQARLAVTPSVAGFARNVYVSGNTAVVASGAGVYVYSRSGEVWSQQAILIPSDGGAVTGFSTIDADTVVIGGPAASINSNPNQGAAYVFTRNGTTWSEQQRLTASDGAAGDGFGKSVAINGDSIIVGAYTDDIGTNPDQGSAYVFVRQGTTWTEQAKLLADDGATLHDFGNVVAINGDTAVVTRDWNNHLAIPNPAAYVFVRIGTNWSQQQKLSVCEPSGNGGAQCGFGSSISIDGDTLAVGNSSLNVESNIAQGGVYVFTRSGTLWSQQQKLTASDGQADDGFGTAVALKDSTIIAGSPASNVRSGAAYLLTRSNATWTEQQKFQEPSPNVSNIYGYSVSISGNTFIVATPRDEGMPGPNSIGAAYVYTQPAVAVARSPYDFDGDGKSDLSIFRPSAGEWYYQSSSNGGVSGFGFGESTDKPVPGDYTGDGKADIAFFRPSTSEWYVLRSEDSTFYAFPFGASGDIPAPADFDGDAKTDVTVYRPSAQTWFVLKSTGGVLSVPFGLPDDIPVPADYDGDGMADVGIYRADLGQWWNLRSSNGNVFAATFGASTDKPVVGDYTGDGKADVAFYRPSEGSWYVLRSEDFTYYAFPFGTSTDKPAPADYDGDGKFDAAVFRPSDTNWYILKSTGGIQIQQFGAANDIPLPGAFVP